LLAGNLVANDYYLQGRRYQVLLPCQLNIAVDGPAGAGKSTVSRAVARALGLSYLDTGSMYRALTWKALQAKVSPGDAGALTALAEQTTWSFTGGGAASQLWMDGRPLPEAIRSDAVTELVSQVSSHQAVRRIMVAKQQELCRAGGFIADGRDIGTVVMPNADMKIYLTASVEERAERRRLEQGKQVSALPDLIEGIRRRDHMDSNRKHSPLLQAEDALVLDTTAMPFERVVDCIVEKALSLCSGEA
jgi:cytidylate kinase